jgi:hypothetical protein
MLKLYRSQPSEDGAKADLDEMDAHLARLLPPVLLGRFHFDVLRHWAYLRCCVASAQEGEYVSSIETMHDGVSNLATVVGQRFGPEPWTASTAPRL